MLAGLDSEKGASPGIVALSATCHRQFLLLVNPSSVITCRQVAISTMGDELSLKARLFETTDQDEKLYASPGMGVSCSRDCNDCQCHVLSIQVHSHRKVHKIYVEHSHRIPLMSTTLDAVFRWLSSLGISGQRQWSLSVAVCGA